MFEIHKRNLNTSLEVYENLTYKSSTRVLAVLLLMARDYMRRKKCSSL